MDKPLSISAVIPVFKDAAHAIATSIELSRQHLPPGASFEILVVDDGSGNGIPDLIESRLPATARLIRHTVNRGRSAARNTGAAVARGTYLLFIDADALPVGPDFLATYIEEIKAGANLAFGAYTTSGQGFWSRYETLSLKRSYERFRNGMHYALSSRNFVIERSLFEACGGFDVRYTQYGFEDRDLFIRALSKGAQVAIATQAVVMHEANTTLASVTRKLHEAGRYTSSIFSGDHPDAYVQLGYKAIDARHHPILAALAAPAAALVPILSKPAERLLENERISFRMRAALARLTSALSYLAGTRKARRPNSKKQ